MKTVEPSTILLPRIFHVSTSDDDVTNDSLNSCHIFDGDDKISNNGSSFGVNDCVFIALTDEEVDDELDANFLGDEWEWIDYK